MSPELENGLTVVSLSIELPAHVKDIVRPTRTAVGITPSTHPLFSKVVMTTCSLSIDHQHLVPSSVKTPKTKRHIYVMADDLFGDSDSSGSQDTYDLIASAKVQPVTVKNKKDRTPKMIATKNKENGDDSSVAGLNDSDKANSSKKDDAHSSKKKAAKEDDNIATPAKKYAAKGYGI